MRGKSGRRCGCVARTVCMLDVGIACSTRRFPSVPSVGTLSPQPKAEGVGAENVIRLS